MDDFPHTVDKRTVYVPLGDRHVTSASGQAHHGKRCRKLRSVVKGDAEFDPHIAKTWVAVEGEQVEHALLNDEITG